MPSAAKLEKAAKFTATSPATGETYTRKSQHAYTHACISRQETESLAVRAEERAASAERRAAFYALVAEQLRAGTAPAAGSPLLGRCTAMSYAMQMAGVRTKWDATMYDLKSSLHPERTRESYAAEHDDWAAQAKAEAVTELARATRIRLEGTVLEGCTFHHSPALAAKEAAKQATYPGNWVSEIVPVTMQEGR